MAVLDSQGATFTIQDSGGTPVTVGGIVSFTAFDGAAADINISTLASTRHEWRQGLAEEGNLGLEIKRDPSDAGQAELLSARNAQATRECVLTLASGDVFTFDAYVRSISATGGVDATVDGSVDLKITGEVVIT